MAGSPAANAEAVQSPDTLLQPRRTPSPRPASTMLQPPVLGRYRLLERLGSGGFGVVWRARDELLHREVAVKRIPLEPGTDDARPSREALAGARLAHPAIVALYEACAEDDAFYLISELVDGRTLAQLIAAGSLTDEHVLEIGVALSEALAHAHARGVIHRDVKPQNVLVPDRPAAARPTPDHLIGAAKLTDFGGARMAGEDVLTRTGDVLGTLAYMAPEQSEGREATEAADLYSLALVLYEALSGANPVRGATPAETARRIGQPVAPLRGMRGEVPAELADAIDRALSPSPDDRGTVGELGGALERAKAHDGASARATHRLARRSASAVPAHLDPPAWDAAPGPAAVEAPAVAPQRESARRSAPDEATSEHPEDGARRRAPLVPRVAWLGCGLAVCVWQAASGRAGVALLVLAAAAPLALLPRRAGVGWLTCALAPLLGMAGLAGAFPAVAGQATRWPRRAALAALGYWWLLLAEPLTGQRLWLARGAEVPARTIWEHSLASSATHVVGPLLGLAALLGAALWAVGAVVLPWIVRGRRAGLDVVAATVWSCALVTLAPALDGGLSAHPSPRGLVLGAILGGAIAVGARALRGPV